MIKQARAYRWQVALGEQSSARNFSAQQKAYEAAPDYFKMRMLLQTLAEGLKDRKKVIVDSKDVDSSIFEDGSEGSVFDDGFTVLRRVRRDVIRGRGVMCV